MQKTNGKDSNTYPCVHKLKRALKAPFLIEMNFDLTQTLLSRTKTEVIDRTDGVAIWSQIVRTEKLVPELIIVLTSDRKTLPDAHIGSPHPARILNACRDCKLFRLENRYCRYP